VGSPVRLLAFAQLYRLRNKVTAIEAIEQGENPGGGGGPPKFRRRDHAHEHEHRTETDGDNEYLEGAVPKHAMRDQPLA
jgi:hypothetical protein